MIFPLPPWRTSAGAALAPAYAGSHLQGVADLMNLSTTFGEYVPQVLAKLAKTPQQSETADQAWDLARLLWHHPAAIYLCDTAAGQGRPNLTAVFLCDAGGDAPKLAQLIQAGHEGSNLRVETRGSLVVISNDQIAAPPAPTQTLADSASFHAIMDRLQDAPALAYFVDTKALLQTLNRVIPANDTDWPHVRDTLQLANINGLGSTEGFDGKDWSSQTFLSAASPRGGLLACMEPKPADPALLAHIPADAASASVSEFDLAKLFDTLHDAVEGTSAAKVVDAQLQRASALVGCDIRRTLIAGLSDQWGDYTRVGGVSGVVINKTGDASSFVTVLADVLDKIAAAFPALPPVRQQTMEGVSVYTLTLPRVGSLTFGAADDATYFSMQPPFAVARAIRSRPQAGATDITHTPAFTQALARLSVPSVGGFDFEDLPRTAPATLQQLNLGLMMLQPVLSARDLPAIPLAIPTMDDLRPHLFPTLEVTWADAQGIYVKSVAPFPGSSMLGNPSTSMATVGGAAMGISVMLPALNRARETANRVKCAANERQILQAMVLYANDHHGQYPPDLAALYLQQPLPLPLDTFICPGSGTTIPPGLRTGSKTEQATWVAEHGDYVYLGAGRTPRSAPDIVVLHERDSAHNGDGENLGFADGHVEFCNPAVAKQYLDNSAGR